jgi:hypothetical protein
MDADKINQSNAEAASLYLRKKFEHFKRGLITKKTRRKKCIEYWIAARGDRRDLVETIYQQIFRELLDIDVAEQLEIAREEEASRHGSMPSQDMHRIKKHRVVEARTTLGLLEKMRDDGDWQEDGFVERLQSMVAFLDDDDIFNPRTVKSEYNALIEKELTSSLDRGDSAITHEGSFIAAAHQRARVEFNSFNPNWGKISAFFEENFRAGVWANDKAKLAWKKTGFTAEIEAAIAIGAQLTLEGEMSWENREHKLTLGGQAEVFLGARANLSGKLSVNALKGLEAAFDAGFFAGFSATISGTASFSYMGKEIVSVSADAAFTFGVGGTVSASLSASIFGPTKISFGANLTLGIGASTNVEVKINFTETRILLTTEFKKLVYIPTLLQGYKMDLQNMEYRNKVYLNLCIGHVQKFIEETGEEVRSYREKPPEKRALLAHY